MRTDYSQPMSTGHVLTVNTEHKLHTVDKEHCNREPVKPDYRSVYITAYTGALGIIVLYVCLRSIKLI